MVSLILQKLYCAAFATSIEKQVLLRGSTFGGWSMHGMNERYFGYFKF